MLSKLEATSSALSFGAQSTATLGASPHAVSDVSHPRKKADNESPLHPTSPPSLADRLIECTFQTLGIAAAIIFGVRSIKAYECSIAANQLAAQANTLATQASELAYTANQLTLLSFCASNSDPRFNPTCEGVLEFMAAQGGRLDEIAAEAGIKAGLSSPSDPTSSSSAASPSSTPIPEFSTAFPTSLPSSSVHLSLSTSPPSPSFSFTPSSSLSPPASLPLSPPVTTHTTDSQLPTSSISVHLSSMSFIPSTPLSSTQSSLLSPPFSPIFEFSPLLIGIWRITNDNSKRHAFNEVFIRICIPNSKQQREHPLTIYPYQLSSFQIFPASIRIHGGTASVHIHDPIVLSLSLAIIVMVISSFPALLTDPSTRDTAFLARTIVRRNPPPTPPDPSISTPGMPVTSPHGHGRLEADTGSLTSGIWGMSVQDYACQSSFCLNISLLPFPLELLHA
ncbi:hypothetical protein R3P38DRAFT_3190344 [Favolaschia claudopus]|uniref:Uncharacterized protein n=1 Tax=Favolaschia claudopus TaxID=2862362 RepID=A0AAW0BQB7_9AGAR